MIVDTEIWKLTSTFYKVSTDKKRLRNKLEKIVGREPSGIYSLKGKEVAWDFTFHKNVLAEIRKVVKEETKKSKNAKSKRTVKKNR